MEEVKRFYENFYAPNEMSLVILDPKGLDEIQREVTLLFSHLQPKHGLQNIKSSGASFGKYDLPRSIELVPSHGRTKSLLLFFPIPDCTQFYKTGVRTQISWFSKETAKFTTHGIMADDPVPAVYFWLRRTHQFDHKFKVIALDKERRS